LQLFGHFSILLIEIFVVLIGLFLLGLWLISGWVDVVENVEKRIALDLNSDLLSLLFLLFLAESWVAGVFPLYFG
jgi:hypothetical protein